MLYSAFCHTSCIKNCSKHRLIRIYKTKDILIHLHLPLLSSPQTPDDTPHENASKQPLKPPLQHTYKKGKMFPRLRVSSFCLYIVLTTLPIHAVQHQSWTSLSQALKTSNTVPSGNAQVLVSSGGVLEVAVQKTLPQVCSRKRREYTVL